MVQCQLFIFGLTLISFQSLAAFGPLLLTVVVGMTLGYSAVLLPQLQEATNDNGGIRINGEEASWVGKIYFVWFFFSLEWSVPNFNSVFFTCSKMSTSTEYIISNTSNITLYTSSLNQPYILTNRITATNTTLWKYFIKMYAISLWLFQFFNYF